MNENDFIIQLQAMLDEMASTKLINQNIDNIKSKLNKLVLSPEIDQAELKNLVATIESITGKKIEIPTISIKIDDKKVVNDAQQIGKQVGNAIGENITQGVNQALNDSKQAIENTKRSFKELNDYKSKYVNGEYNDKGKQIVQGKTFNDEQVKDVSTLFADVRKDFEQFGQVTITKGKQIDGILDSLHVKIQQINGDLKTTSEFDLFLSKTKDGYKFTDNDTIKTSESLVHHLDEAKNATDKVITENEKIANQMANLREKSESLRQAEERRSEVAQSNAVNKALEDEYNQRLKLEEQLSKLKTNSVGFDQMNSFISELENKEIKLGDAKSLNDFAKSLKNAEEQLANFKREAKLLANDNQVKNAIYQLNKQLQDNSRYTKEAKDKIKAWIVKFEQGDVAKQRLQQVRIEAKQLHSEMDGLNRTGKTFFETIESKIGQLSAYLSATMFISKAFDFTKDGIRLIRELDTALVDLKKTAHMTDSELENFYYTSNDVAKQMGVSTKAIIEQASAWSRLGYNTADQATKMAKLSSQFARISPGMSINDATTGLVSIMKAYDMSVDDVLDGIQSKVNIIGNNLALSNADIIAMLQDSVSAMAEGRNSLEETIALESAAFEIAQDQNVGNGLKTVALRLRGMNEETQELDDSLKTIKGDLYELTGISIMEDETTYKITYQILKEISGVWDTLTDKTRADVLELMFGKHRANIGAAVIKNFSAAEKAMDLMADSAGDADKELTIAMDSIDYKMNELAETGTAIAQNLFQRDDIKTVIDVLTSLAEVIETVTDKLGLFGTASLASGLLMNRFGVGEYEIPIIIL